MRSVALLSMHSSPLATPGLSDAGGMNLYVRRLADDLAARGFQVDVFTRRSDARAPEISLSSSGVRVVHIEAGPARPLPKSVLSLHVPVFADAAIRFAREHHARYEIIHSHYWLSGLAGLRMRDAFGVPQIHMFHTLSRVKEFYLGEPDPADTIHRSDGERRIIAEVDAIVGATPEEGALMERLYGHRPASFAVVPPGVDPRIFHPLDRQAARRSLGIEADKVILYVGRVDRIKGLDTLLRAVAELHHPARRVRLVIAGGAKRGRDAELDRYRELAQLLGIGRAVSFVGSVPPSKLPAYYSAADVCAVPSAYESFGMAAVEAMACGTPVVGYRVGGLAQTVKDGQTGFLATPGNPQDFTARLRAALESDGLVSMGCQARVSVQRYTWTSVVERTLELYERATRVRLCQSRRAAGES